MMPGGLCVDRFPICNEGIDYEANLIDPLLNDLTMEGIAPAQLQIVCSTLYESLGSEQVITTQMYEDLDGVAGILQDYLDRLLTRDLPSEHRQAAKLTLSSLVTPTGQRDRKSCDRCDGSAR